MGQVGRQALSCFKAVAVGGRVCHVSRTVVPQTRRPKPARPAWSCYGGAGASRSLSLSCGPPPGQLPQTAPPGQLPCSAEVGMSSKAWRTRAGPALLDKLSAERLEPGPAAARLARRARRSGRPSGRPGPRRSCRRRRRRGSCRAARRSSWRTTSWTPASPATAWPWSACTRRCRRARPARSAASSARCSSRAPRGSSCATAVRPRASRRLPARARAPVFFLQARRGRGAHRVSRALVGRDGRAPRPECCSPVCRELLKLSVRVAYPCGGLCVAAAHTDLVGSRRIDHVAPHAASCSSPCFPD